MRVLDLDRWRDTFSESILELDLDRRRESSALGLDFDRLVRRLGVCLSEPRPRSIVSIASIYELDGPASTAASKLWR